MKQDDSWMRKALVLARRGAGRVFPNPMVGAVLVRGGRIVGQGWHRAYGQPHAEAEAIRNAGARARGAVLYVTLEPCNHWGKTPPCVEALRASGIRRVVAAMRDPNPRVSGSGFAALRRSGIAVSVGLLESEALELNRAFVTRMRHQRPYVILKRAVSLDGRTATVSGQSQWITSGAARAAGHGLRTKVDAIAVGIQTVLSDNPSLGSHGGSADPIRVVFDSRLRIPERARVLRNDGRAWILTTMKTGAKRRRLERRGVRVITVSATKQSRLEIAAALKALSAQGIGTLLLEGGATLQESFLEAGAVDEAQWFVAPVILGHRRWLGDAWRLRGARASRIGEDWIIQGRLTSL